jgi:hypothetical protein
MGNLLLLMARVGHKFQSTKIKESQIIRNNGRSEQKVIHLANDGMIVTQDAKKDGLACAKTCIRITASG